MSAHLYNTDCVIIYRYIGDSHYNNIYRPSRYIYRLGILDFGHIPTFYVRDSTLGPDHTSNLI